MLYLIGLGLKPSQLTMEAKEAIGKCCRLFLEAYTSNYSEGTIAELKQIIGKDFIALERKGVEEGFGVIMCNARKLGEDIGLLVFGNPLSATTHVQLLLEAKGFGIPVKVIPGISIYDCLAETGLDQYRFGRTCTIVAPKPNYEPESFYDIIEKNFENGLHSLCLLDIDTEHGKMMGVGEALTILQRIEKKRKKGILQKATLMGLYAMGSGRQIVKAGTLKELSRSGYNVFPQSLIIAAPLNEKEEEALRELHGGN